MACLLHFCLRAGMLNYVGFSFKVRKISQLDFATFDAFILAYMSRQIVLFIF